MKSAADTEQRSETAPSRDAARYAQVRKMMLTETMSLFFSKHQWPSGSDKRVSEADFDEAIDYALKNAAPQEVPAVESARTSERTTRKTVADPLASVNSANQPAESASSSRCVAVPWNSEPKCPACGAPGVGRCEAPGCPAPRSATGTILAEGTLIVEHGLARVTMPEAANLPHGEYPITVGYQSAKPVTERRLCTRPDCTETRPDRVPCEWAECPMRRPDETAKK